MHNSQYFFLFLMNDWTKANVPVVLAEWQQKL